ncbi:DUF1127 domain-containing protein [Pontivivens ytuae]|nr:DUF1127 domain-containing protein [Pontivivens ytuae]
MFTTATLPHARTGTSIVDRIAARLVTMRTRAQLAKLDDHMLRDLGLTEGEALREARRPFWD